MNILKNQTAKILQESDTTINSVKNKHYQIGKLYKVCWEFSGVEHNKWAKKFFLVDDLFLKSWTPGGSLNAFSKGIIGYNFDETALSTKIAMVSDIYLVNFAKDLSGPPIILEYPMLLIGDKKLIPSYSAVFETEVLKLVE